MSFKTTLYRWRAIFSIAASLERIADALDRMYPPPEKNTPPRKPAGLEALSEFDPEKEWEREQQEGQEGG